MSMQVVEKSTEGLSRILSVTVPQDELVAKLDARLAEMAPKMKINGFRPGKVPTAHVRKLYGKELMGEIVNETVNETSQKVLEDKNLRAAAPAEITPTTDVDQVLAGKADLAYDMALEVMPEFTPVDPKTLKLTKPVYAATEADVAEALAELASQSKRYEAKTAKTAKAADGDQLLIDFVGRIDGDAFEGGSAEDATLTIGSGQFIPGFEEQLTGAKAGETKTITVTFPENYGAAHLAGKPAEFEVTVKEVRAPKDQTVDDAFAKQVGLADLAALQDLMKKNLEQQYGQASRFKLKRALLDVLDEKHDFPLPPRMVEAEFSGIWNEIQNQKKAGNLPDEDKAKSDADLEAEYRKISERRVRLGLVLAEIGRAADVQVSDQELNAALMAEARQYPGQEQQILNFYRQNPNAAAQLRAPIYEEKVCDLIFDKAKVTDKAVSKAELEADDEG